MVDSLKAQRVPWLHLEKYLEAHKTGIATYLDLLKNNLVSIP